MQQAPFFPTLCYRDVRTALDWLARAFGFETTMVVTNQDGSLGHCEMTYNGAVVNIGREWATWARSPASVEGANTAAIGCSVADADSHCAHARAAGARILSEPKDEFYGAWIYMAADPEGHVWRFSQVLKHMSREDMEAASGGRKVRQTL